MTDSFQTIITRQGAALIADAVTRGADFRLATLVAGSRDAPPDETATRVPDEVWRGPITGVTAGADAGVAVIDAAIPLDEGGFTVRQIGVEDAEGNLILHANVPEAFKPSRAAGAIRDLAYRLVVRFANAKAVNLLIDPHVVTATRHWTEHFVAEAVAAHAGDPAAHPLATEDGRGFTELATVEETIAGSDDSRAVHPAGLTAALEAFGESHRQDQATTLAAGITRYATAAEAAAGVVADAALTPSAAAVLGGRLPVGTVFAFAGATPPDGALKANGAAVTRALYSALDEAIYVGDVANATALFGYRASTAISPQNNRDPRGDYLVLPDLRGEFLRGWDDGRGIDTNRGFGTQQNHAIKHHTGRIGARNYAGGHRVFDRHPTGVFSEWGYVGTKFKTRDNTKGSPYGISHIDFNIGSGNETRPRNLALLYCIAYR